MKSLNLCIFPVSNTIGKNLTFILSQISPNLDRETGYRKESAFFYLFLELQLKAGIGFLSLHGISLDILVGVF